MTRSAMNSAAESLLTQAMNRYQEDPLRGDFLIQCACTQAPDPLPLHRISYKFYNRQRRFEQAQEFAQRALQEAGRQAGLPADIEHWTRASLRQLDGGLASHGLLALKALAFINLRAGNEVAAGPYLQHLARLDPEDGSGASVVAALMASLSRP